MEPIFVFGAGGHAKVVLSIIEEQGLYEVALVVDDGPEMEGRTLCGRPVWIGRESLIDSAPAGRVTNGIIAVGDNASRIELALWASRVGLQPVSAVHPSAIIADGCTIGPGSVLMAGTVINVDTAIGDHAIINTCASVDHDCTVGNGVHIAPGCRLCGGVTVRDGALIGAGSVIVPGVTVGRDAVVGAGSAVIRDIPDGIVAAGNPCRPLGRLTR